MIKCEFEERRLIYDGWENTELQPLEICAKQSLKTMTLFMLGEGSGGEVGSFHVLPNIRKFMNLYFIVLMIEGAQMKFILVDVYPLCSR